MPTAFWESSSLSYTNIFKSSFAPWIFTNKNFFNHFARKTSRVRFFKGVIRMQRVRRFSFKKPMTVGAFDNEFG